MKSQKVILKNNKSNNFKKSSFQKNIKKKFEKVNYHDFLHTGNYVDYFKRRCNDDRINFFESQYFENSSVCDYGCHNGDFSFKLFEKFHKIISKYDGIDVQMECISNAQKMLVSKVKRQIQGEFPDVDYNKIFFQLGNWVDDNYQIESNCPGQYNVILVLSVTKWIHLFHGDKGLKVFFHKVFNRLRSGGYLYLEPQGKQSYIKTVNEFGGFIEESYKSLSILPDNLRPILEEIGFDFIKIVKEKITGQSFNRDILLFVKSERKKISNNE